MTVLSFNQAFEEALKSPRYDVLTGRSPDPQAFFNTLRQKFLENVLLPLLRRIGMNLPDISVPESNTTLLRVLFAAAGVIGLLLLIALIFRLVSRRKRRVQTMEEIFAALKSNGLSYKSLLQEADALALKGCYRDAIRYDYISVLWVFNSRGLIALTDYKTNTQFKQEVRRNAESFYTPFAEAVGLFQRCWFGHKRIDPKTYEENKANMLKMIQEALAYEKNP